jgi:outer membrane protein OmpA-like peptidoglycan-associated protein
MTPSHTLPLKGSQAAAVMVSMWALMHFAHADSTGGVDAALFRASMDTTGVYSLDGARLMPKRDISWKVLLSYASSPLEAAVPGIGGANDTKADRLLGSLATIDMTFGMSFTNRFAMGLDVAAYRTSTAAGYGKRARFSSAGPVGKSTGAIALRALSNIDPSGGFQDDGLAGPLDVRLTGKFLVFAASKTAVSLLGTVSLPFGEQDMMLGDASFVFEPKIAVDYRPKQTTATRLVANLGAKLRQRSVLEGYDTSDDTKTVDDSLAYLDIGSELNAGIGALMQVSPRIVVGAELTALLPLPNAVSFGSCRLYSGARCSTLQKGDYVAGGSAGDTTVLGNVGLTIQINESTSASVLGGFGAVGARADDLRVSTAISWSPQVEGTTVINATDRDRDGIFDGSDGCPDDVEDKDGFQDNDGCPESDNDGDGIADSSDNCPEQPEDKDAWQDDDGCPEPDNDSDGVADVTDRCPDQKEDSDGFQDDDGCPEDDNDGDGLADAVDKCPNDAETINGIADADGCPDSKGAGSVEEAGDRIDLKGAVVTFKNNTLTAAGKQVLNSVASVIIDKKLTIRVEVHVALGTKSKVPKLIATAQKKDKDIALRRALQILDYLASKGIPLAQLQAVGIGSDRPLGTSLPTDNINERVDFIKAQQRTP